MNAFCLFAEVRLERHCIQTYNNSPHARHVTEDVFACGVPHAVHVRACCSKPLASVAEVGASTIVPLETMSCSGLRFSSPSEYLVAARDAEADDVVFLSSLMLGII